MKARTITAGLLAIGLVLAACDSEVAELSTTSSLVVGTTEVPDPETTTTVATSEAPTTTLVGERVVSYDVQARISTDNGEILYIVIPPAAYTDIDLENFIGDLIETDPPPWGVEVFDDAQAVQAFVIPPGQRTEEQQSLLDEHHFVSLINGDTISFKGPFSDSGEYVIGS